MLKITNSCSEIGLSAGVVFAEGVSNLPTPEALKALIADSVQRNAQNPFLTEPLKLAVRDLLRRGGFKPSGRSKPASEYLARCADENNFPLINNLVDINNLLSLETGLPISLLDAAAFEGQGLLLRTGKAEERYVFNAGGQEIDLSGLICACRSNPAPGVPLGNPVKDSMQGKISAKTETVIGIIYAPRATISNALLEEHLKEFAALLVEFGSASAEPVTKPKIKAAIF